MAVKMAPVPDGTVIVAPNTFPLAQFVHRPVKTSFEVIAMIL